MSLVKNMHLLGINNGVFICRTTKGQPYISCIPSSWELDEKLKYFNVSFPLSIILIEIL